MLHFFFCSTPLLGDGSAHPQKAIVSEYGVIVSEFAPTEKPVVFGLHTPAKVLRDGQKGSILKEKHCGDDGMLFARYKISVKDAMNVYNCSDRFKRRLSSGWYIYVDSCFCVNHPKYIDRNATVATLTDYAREHKDECCLSFTTFDVGGLVGGALADICIPGCGVVIPSLTLNPKYQEDPKKADEQEKLLAETLNAILSLAGELPNNFSKMLDKLINAKGMKEEDLAESSNLSEKTIQRLRNHEPKAVELETVIQLCIGLHLHPILSGYLLRAANQHFMDTNLPLNEQI